jgi:hypothetical protein
MDASVCSLFGKVLGMLDFHSKGCFKNPKRQKKSAEGDLAPDEDITMEQILENINNTPIGQVLKKIASLPENRQQKILKVRRLLTEGNYKLNERLDVVLEKVLEDLTS